MSNVVSINCTCEYLLRRAARHRRAGRYDEAMALLWKARNLFGMDEEILLEMARVYDEIGCEDEAARAYLRIVRLDGVHRAQALFHLALSSAQIGDIQRAISYFDHFRQIRKQSEISSEMAEILERQLQADGRNSFSRSRAARARALEKRAAARLQAGKVAAAQRAIEHALKLRENARGYTVLACCQLLRGELQDAIASAQIAHGISPANVQTLCVLADAYMASGDEMHAHRAVYLAAIRAHEADDLLAAAVESAKICDDKLTLRLTQRILRLAPFHTRAMMIRACALINCKRYKAAGRILGRLCGLLPEDTVSESYYKRLRDGQVFDERLSLGVDVTHEEGVSRAAELVSMLCADAKMLDEDNGICARICRLCDWAFHSPMAGPSTKMVSLALLASLSSDQAKGTLADLMMDPQLPDSLKLSALQLLTAKDGFYPYEIDMGGKLVRLAAGGVSTQLLRTGEANSRIVQRVADRLASRYPDAPQIVLDAYLAYQAVYGQTESRHESSCAAALEYWYALRSGILSKPEEIAAQYGVSVRIMRMFLRRLESCIQEKES
ncbi:MAG: hypothetical protein E7321_02335 [Clostridiales bacterium]|nr:hypothetical protein [Clostridiales bacterium]